MLILGGGFLRQGLDPSLDRSSNRTNLYQPSTEEKKACNIPMVLSLEECLDLAWQAGPDSDAQNTPFTTWIAETGPGHSWHNSLDFS